MIKKSAFFLQIPYMFTRGFWPFDFLDGFIFENWIVINIILTGMTSNREIAFEILSAEASAEWLELEQGTVFEKMGTKHRRVA